MKFLFLGGSGNLSSVVLLDLLQGGHKVDCITRGNNINLESKAIKQGANFLHFLDLNHATNFEINALSSSYDIIIDFISYNKDDLASRFYTLSKYASRAYIFISTTAIYLRSNQVQRVHSEDNFLCLKEWKYAYNKFLAELWFEETSKKSSLKTLTIRLGHTIGSSIPVYLGNPGHAFLEHLLSSKPIPCIGKADHPWSVGTASGLSQLFKQLPYVIDNLPNHLTIHYSGLVTTWLDIMKTLCISLNINAKFKYLPVSMVNKITPEWLPSIIYHKMYPDLYDLSRLKKYFLIPQYESLDKILMSTINITLSSPKELNYQKNLEKMKALDEILL